MAFFRDVKAVGVVALLLVGLPFATSNFLAYQLALYLVYGIAAQGVALCWGRLGFLPLGQGLFFGLGAYLTGGALRAGEHAREGYLLLVPALLVAPALAYIISRLVFARSNRSGPYFSLITLALTMLGFLGAQLWNSVTGGFNGLGNLPDLPGTDRYSTLYWAVAAIALAVLAGLCLAYARPLGVLWSAVAQNEERMQLLGYATERIKAAGFALSAFLAAVAGALFAAHQGIVTPQVMGFVLSTELVIWCAVGGKASAVGPLLGAVIVGYASAELRERFAYWEAAVALLFMTVVIFLPKGIAGLMAPGTSRSRHQDARAAAPFPAQRRTPASVRLALEDVRTAQGGVQILRGLDLTVQGPGIRCVIGPNGAGKTSTFNVITGRLPLLGGHIMLDGCDIGSLRAWQVARLGVGRKMQVPAVFHELTVGENLVLAQWAGRLRPTDLLRIGPFHWRSDLLDLLLEEFPDLAASWDKQAGTLSQGHRQALEFVMTMLPQPRLVLLDEPCAGLSPAETHHMIDAIRKAVAHIGAAALLIEHDISAVQALGAEVLVLHQGQVLARGPLAQVQQDPEVRAVYAGGSK